MRRTTLFVAAIVASISTSAFAGIIAPDLSVTLTINGGDSIHLYPTGTPAGNNTWEFNGSYHDDPTWGMDLSMLVDPDPLISSNIAFQNLSSTTNTYVITVTLPISPPMPGINFMDGSVGGSVTDANGDGSATVAAVGPLGEIYNGLIDGSPALGAQLLPFPYSASPVNSGGTASVGTASFGQPIPIPTGSALTSIGITLEFSLTPGDSVALTSFFRVVPGPGGLAILAVAGLISRRRRD